MYYFVPYHLTYTLGNSRSPVEFLPFGFILKALNELTLFPNSNCNRESDFLVTALLPHVSHPSPVG